MEWLAQLPVKAANLSFDCAQCLFQGCYYAHVRAFAGPWILKRVIKNIRSGRATGLGSYSQRILGAKMSSDALSLVSVIFATFSKRQLPR